MTYTDDKFIISGDASGIKGAGEVVDGTQTVIGSEGKDGVIKRGDGMIKGVGDV